MDNEASSGTQPHTMYIALTRERVSRQMRDSIASAMRVQFPDAPVTIIWDNPPKDDKPDVARVWISVSGYRPRVWEAVYRHFQSLARAVHIESVALDPTFGLAMFNYVESQPSSVCFKDMMRHLLGLNEAARHAHAQRAAQSQRSSAFQRELVEQHLAAYVDDVARRALLSDIDRLVELAVDEALTEERIAAADR